jgi:hypothetical protein
MRTVTLGGEERQVNGFSGRKALRAGKLTKEIMRQAPHLSTVWREAAETAERHATQTLSRAEATTFLGPERAAAITEEAWAASNHSYEIVRPYDPMGQQIAAVFPEAFDHAEGAVLQLLALIIVGDRELKETALHGAAEGGQGGADAVTTLLDRLGEDLLDNPADELLELAVVAGEVLEDQFYTRVRNLGSRLGKLRNLFGGITEPEPAIEAEPEEEESPSSDGRSETTEDLLSKEESSTPSPAPTDGDPMSSSIPPGPSSASSVPA